MRLMKAARLHSIGNFHVEELPVPEPQGRELLLKVNAAGICGSDLPRIYEHGTSNGNYPLTIGHEFCGTVVSAGPDAAPENIGKRGAVYPLIPCLHCTPCLLGNYAMCENYDYLGSRRDGGFAEYCLVPSDWHMNYTDDATLSDESLAMMEPATVAQHAVRMAQTSAGDFMVIFGAGPIGIMAARWASIFGASRILLIDIIDEKLQFAAERENVLTANSAEDLPAVIRSYNHGRLADVIIEGSGAGSALGQAIYCVKAQGHIALLGNPSGDTALKRKDYSQILRQEIHLHGIWNSAYFTPRRNEWKYTLDMLEQKKLQVDDLVTHKVTLDNLPSLIERIHNHNVIISKAMCLMK